MYSTIPGDVRTNWAKAFQSQYGIAMESVFGRTPEIVEKVVKERKAGLFLPDIYTGATSASVVRFKPEGFLDPIPPVLMLPEVLDMKVWRGQRFLFEDKEQQYALAFTAYNTPPVMVNSQMVKPEEMRLYNDLLNPRWKGKIVMEDPTIPGSGARWLMTVMDSPLFGLNFIRELAKQDPIVTRDLRLQVEWVAQGKFPIATTPRPEIFEEFRRAGAPLKIIQPQDKFYYTNTGTGTVSLINQAPHPNAAKVFLNWLLSKEGQAIYARTTGIPSSRLDVSTEGAEPMRILDPSVTEVNAAGENFLLKEQERHTLFREIFGHLIK